jgi:soluble lytic murein transglycosylase-like protein
MRRLTICLVGILAATVLAGPAVAGTSGGIAALQVALRAKGHYPAAVDGVDGPLTRAGLTGFQKRHGLAPTGRVGQKTRAALGALGSPLLGQRELGVGAVGWDVSSLEFELIPYGLSRTAVDGRFTPATAKALARLQAARGLPADGIAGRQTYRTLASHAKAAFTPPVRATYTVRAGDSFSSIAGALGVSPLVLAAENRLKLSAVIVPGQKLVLPVGSRENGGVPDTGSATPGTPDAVRASLDRWSAAYGVDAKLARAVAWMESGFRPDVVSSVGAVGVMQLLPGTWKWIDEALLRTTTPRTFDGNIRVGVRYLRWLLDEFDGDVRHALAGYYQGAQAVRDRGLFDDTKRYVSIILKLYGTV